MGDPDLPPDASLEQLTLHYQQILHKLQENKEVSEDECDGNRTLIRQLERINTRIKNLHTNVEAPTDLPPELRFVEGYEHLQQNKRNTSLKYCGPKVRSS